jgi:hypothetical protein
VVAGAGGVVTPASVQVRLLTSALFQLLVQLLLLVLLSLLLVLVQVELSLLVLLVQLVLLLHVPLLMQLLCVVFNAGVAAPAIFECRHVACCKLVVMMMCDI